jgi:hypothetical protein
MMVQLGQVEELWDTARQSGGGGCGTQTAGLDFEWWSI